MFACCYSGYANKPKIFMPLRIRLQAMLKKLVLVNVHLKSTFCGILKCQLCKIILNLSILILYSLLTQSSFICCTPHGHLALTKWHIVVCVSLKSIHWCLAVEEDQKGLMPTFFTLIYSHEMQPLILLLRQIVGISTLLSFFLMKEGKINVEF